jgi:DNA-binding NarL/FixJ family response regulator
MTRNEALISIATMTEPLRVLIVEDEGLVAMLLEDMADELGHHVVGTAFSLNDGLDKASTLELDLAIVDIRLPQGTSEPILKILDARGIRVVISSGFNDPEGAAFENRVQLSKPYEFEALKRAIDEVMLGKPLRAS